MPSKKHLKLLKKSSQLETRKRFLIVCEGTKTEPTYFKHIKDKLKIPTTDIEVVSGSGTDPVSIFETAKKLQDEEPANNKYDKVFCVIDRDEHPNFDTAIQKMQGKKFIHIVSVPSIEYWFLLHFSDSTRPFIREGNKSGAGNCEKRLKEVMQQKARVQYRKNMPADVFEILYANMNTKINGMDTKDRAEKSMQNVNKPGEKNPSTEVHILIKELEDLKKKN